MSKSHLVKKLTFSDFLKLLQLFILQEIGGKFENSVNTEKIHQIYYKIQWLLWTDLYWQKSMMKSESLPKPVYFAGVLTA